MDSPSTVSTSALAAMMLWAWLFAAKWTEVEVRQPRRVPREATPTADRCIQKKG